MNDSGRRETAVQATLSAAHLIVPGMGSDHCVGLVSTSLRRLDGVANIRTNIAA